MAETDSELKKKIKIVTNLLCMVRRQVSEFSRVDKALKDSEMYLNLLIKDWNTNYETGSNLNNEIISLGDEFDYDYKNYIENDIFAKLRNVYLSHSSTLHGMLKIVVTSENHDLNLTHSELTSSTFQRLNVNINPGPSSASRPEQCFVNESYNLQLASLKIPEFQGDYDKWHEFKDSMETHVNSNASLTNALKLDILLKHLKGDAQRVVKRDRSKLIPENYNNLWELLVKRYDHRRSLIYSYFNLLLNQDFVEKESANALKQIHDCTFDSLGCLQSMKVETKGWDDLLVYVIYSALPLRTKELWDEKLGKTDELPNFTDLMDFIETRFRVLEGIESTKRLTYSNNKSSQKQNHFNSKKTTLQSSAKEPKKSTLKKKISADGSKASCKCCSKGSHALRFCKKFQNLSAQERINVVNSIDFCYNCLCEHSIEDCKSEYRCGFCGFKHHTMLHLDSKLPKNPRNQEEVAAATNNSLGNTQRRAQNLLTNADENVFFPTAIVNVQARNGIKFQFRAIVDACADLSYISENAVARLQLQRYPTYVETAGLNNSSTGASRYFVSLDIQSLHDKNFNLNIRAYVVKQICDHKPSNKFSIQSLVPKGVHLADYRFNVPGKVDMLLGGAVDSKIALSHNIKSVCGNVVFKETKLGYIANGLIPSSISVTSLNCCSKAIKGNCELDNTLRSFWEIEEISNVKILSTDEKLAEDHYVKFTNRLADGRYLVSLPFKNPDIEGFINMRKFAFSRFSSLERKLHANKDLKEMYHACMNEYIEMGHMYEVNPSEYPNGYYLPHHSVLKESSTTTKLRVVFDASARDSNLVSLNENLHTGPRLQADLMDLILKFRTFKFAFNADIEKMYRQILVDASDHKFQLLIWRPDCNSEPKTYAMNRVTFGTTPAPFLAVRTLYKLAEDERERFPVGAACLEKGFYVDDLIYGADSMQEALLVQNQTINILKSAGFHLRKWSANNLQLLENIPEEDREKKSLLSFHDGTSVKTLGIQWSPSEDTFHFQISFQDKPSFTKRTTLSEIARIFDPLGWVSPSVILAKKLIQDIWLEKIEWDDSLPEPLHQRWVKLREELKYISELQIPRWVQTESGQNNVELHGFADASEMAYAALVYVRVEKDDGVFTNLIISKTKVAPIQKLSIPRLELSAALLLSKLINHVASVLEIQSSNIFCWSDSTITLAWINESPHKRTTYVANRVSEIQALTKQHSWRHIGTKMNPADIASRGLYPKELENNTLWWHGPEILNSFDRSTEQMVELDSVILPSEENKKDPTSKKGLIAIKTITSLLSMKPRSLLEVSANLTNYQQNEIINRFSTLSRLVRVIAYCKRVRKCNRTPHLHITPSEYDAALTTILKMVQLDCFSKEFSQISSHKSLEKSSRIWQLNPMICSRDGLLRVNGRLSNAKHISFEQRFPVILPYENRLSELIVRHAHLTTLHGTNQETQMYVCQKYCIIRCKVLVKKISNRCTVCCRYRAAVTSQQMGQLPEARVTPERPFANCGIDFAGPFELKMWRGRCNKFHKSYFAIYVCFSTKAVHLEVVIDLSTAAFIASYRRFIARRGIAKNIYTDCGSNFVGAQKLVTRSIMDCNKKWNEEIAKELAQFQTNWHFNPPSAPHFGGLWEAGVKSVKHHIRRVMGLARLTYDEFETLLLQIESCLNSRPITKIDNDPNSVVLTPGHFLIGEPLNALPDHNLRDQKSTYGERWNYIQHLLQEVWRFWSSDYLNLLRDRQKWKVGKENIKVNDVVLIKEDNLPPNSWLKGLVLEVHPDKQGAVRVATIKTKTNILKRPIVKLAPLPIHDAFESLPYNNSN